MNRTLRIAVASGKGGTGKTTFATNLATVLARSGVRTAYVDCDVEEPNGHIFLRPTIRSTHQVPLLVPEVDHDRCTLCGNCAKVCRSSAIVVLPKSVLTFPKLCHGCGGCTLACPEGAIREVPRFIGVVEEGLAGPLSFLQGRVNVGESMAPPVIDAVLAAAPTQGTTVIDAPPGTACPAIASVKNADVVLLVTEPTPFGLNDLKLAVEMVRELGLPFGVAVNRAGVGDGAVLEYCASEDIQILLEIPNDRRIAQAYSRGKLCVDALPELEPHFQELYLKLSAMAGTSQPKGPARPAVAFVEDPQRAPFPSELVPAGASRNLRDLVVISGKGGTGKTSIVASFIALAKPTAIADCDVDAADLHLVLSPTEQQRRPFSGGSTARIDAARCAGCGECAEHCRFDAIRTPPEDSTAAYAVDTVSCEGCGVCVDVCPAHAATLVPTKNGEWFVAETRHGPMVHARLGIAQENSGKLVTLVRREAEAVAESCGRDLLLCDGSPGLGCPVIASISGACLVLVVTEPTLSGLHDLQRVAELCGQLDVQAGVCINKVDINPEVSAEIEADALRRGMALFGNVRYDEAVITAQVRQQTVVELGDGPAAMDIRALWTKVETALRGP